MNISQKLEGVLLKVQKPGRYTGGEQGSVVKNKADVDMRFAFCFPDVYDIGMSHLGMKILYGLYNNEDNIWCERVFAPWPDMQKQMAEHDIRLYGLESRDTLDEFDMIGFTLQYELSYTNVLNMLELGGIELYAKDRHTLKNIVIAGGPCACNPEPLSDFIDIFVQGEGEEVNLELSRLYIDCVKAGVTKREFLKRAAEIEGIYVPSLYSVEYNGDGTVKAYTPHGGAPARVRKRIISDLDSAFYPDNFVVPFVETVHDRAVQEIFRGCIRGCRFCQAGFIYRPVREKSSEVSNRQAHELCDNTGYDELSLLSLSTSDYTELEPLLNELLDWTDGERTSINLPSLRIDNFPDELAEKLNSVRKTGITFAPEAGTQRLRDIINKNITEEDIMSSCRRVFERGYTSVKLYFMLGLPFETDDDIIGIAELAQKIVDLYYSLPTRQKGKAISVSIGLSTFTPKPHTPFQWHAQDTGEEINRKQRLLLEHIRTKKISVSWNDSHMSLMESALSRGDRRLGGVIYNAYKAGCRFDSWDEFFDIAKWRAAFEKEGLTPEFYANRQRGLDEVLPWDHMDYGIDKKFLAAELNRAKHGITTPNCREQCSGCGAACFKSGICTQKRGSGPASESSSKTAAAGTSR